MKFRKTHKNTAEDKKVKEFLLQKQNIPTIETLLEQELNSLQHLFENIQLEKLNNTSQRKELSTLLEDVKTEVDSFLDVEISKPCTVSYPHLFNKPFRLSWYCALAAAGCITAQSYSLAEGGELPAWAFSLSIGLFLANVYLAGRFAKEKGTKYSPISRHITVEKKRRTTTIPSLAHEYTHHVQHVMKLNLGKCLSEGNARGVERYVSSRYQEKENNSLFMIDVTAETIDELGYVYAWMCKELGVKSAFPNMTSLYSQTDFTKPSLHAFGNAFTSLKEKEIGTQVYNDLVHGKFQW